MFCPFSLSRPFHATSVIILNAWLLSVHFVSNFLSIDLEYTYLVANKNCYQHKLQSLDRVTQNQGNYFSLRAEPGDTKDVKDTRGNDVIKQGKVPSKLCFQCSWIPFNFSAGNIIVHTQPFHLYVMALFS